MGRRLVLALARTPSLRVHLSAPTVRLPLPPRIRAPSVRDVALGLGLLCLVAAAYAAARESSVFAVRTVAISGAGPTVARDVRTALSDVHGTSLMALDPDGVEAVVEGLPSVRRARVDRAFPDRLAVAVMPERRLAVVEAGDDAWLLAKTGTVIRELKRGAVTQLPRIVLPSSLVLHAGVVLTGNDAASALAVLHALPRRFPMPVVSVRPVDGAVTAALEGGLLLRLGPPADLDAKLAAATAVLGSLSDDERDRLRYVDVSVPQRPVAGTNAQVESEG